MEYIDIIIVAISVIFLLILWMVVGVRHLSHLKQSIDIQWEVVDDRVRKRHNFLPALIETVRVHDLGKEQLEEQMIKERIKAAKEQLPGAKKIEYEHDLSMTIKKMLGLGKENNELMKDIYFLELKKNITDVEQEIEVRTKKYNEMVRRYNKNRAAFYLIPLAAIFGFKVMNIFEIEV